MTQPPSPQLWFVGGDSRVVKRAQASGWGCRFESVSPQDCGPTRGPGSGFSRIRERGTHAHV